MINVPLQDYITIRVDSTVASVIQNETGWLDLAGFQDLVAFLEVKEFSGATTINISYETSPSKDEDLFTNMATAVTLVTGVTATKMLKASATVPLARWVRWKLAATTISGSWDAYFRVWLACNRAGRKGAIPLAPDTRNRMLPMEPSVPLTRRSSNMPGTATIVGTNVGTPGLSGAVDAATFQRMTWGTASKPTNIP